VRGPSGIAVAEWPGAREIVEDGRGGSDAACALVAERLATLAPEVAAIALVCPHSAALRPYVEQALPQGAVIVDGIDLAVERMRRLLALSGLQVRRRRAGRSIVLSTDPNRAGGLAVALRS
jgi:glutamate racemase